MYTLGKDILSNNGHPGSVLMFAQRIFKIIRAGVSSEAGFFTNLTSKANTVVKDGLATPTLLLRVPIAAFDPPGVRLCLTLVIVSKPTMGTH